MKIIILPLVILLTIMILAQAKTHVNFNPYTPVNVDNTFNPQISGIQNINGSDSQYSQFTQFGTFTPDVLNGVIAVVVGISALGAVLGIRVLGSGLSDTAQMILYKSIFFYAIWGICSVFALDSRDGLLSIPNNVGSIFYFIMTLFYSIGIVQSIGLFSSGGT